MLPFPHLTNTGRLVTGVIALATQAGADQATAAVETGVGLAGEATRSVGADLSDETATPRIVHPFVELTTKHADMG